MPTPPLLVLLAIGAVAGALSGLFGIGGGVIIEPALVYFVGFDQHLATGTSLAILLPPVGIERRPEVNPTLAVVFERRAVRLVLDKRQTIGAVARELDLTASALAGWVKHARAERTQGKTGLMKEEREVLKKPRPSSRKTTAEVRVDRRRAGP
jgi:hypothetical protein